MSTTHSATCPTCHEVMTMAVTTSKSPNTDINRWRNKVRAHTAQCRANATTIRATLPGPLTTRGLVTLPSDAHGNDLLQAEAHRDRVRHFAGTVPFGPVMPTDYETIGTLIVRRDGLVVGRHSPTQNGTLRATLAQGFTDRIDVLETLPESLGIKWEVNRLGRAVEYLTLRAEPGRKARAREQANLRERRRSAGVKLRAAQASGDPDWIDNARTRAAKVLRRVRGTMDGPIGCKRANLGYGPSC